MFFRHLKLFLKRKTLIQSDVFCRNAEVPLSVISVRFLLRHVRQSVESASCGLGLSGGGGLLFANQSRTKLFVPHIIIICPSLCCLQDVSPLTQKQPNKQKHNTAFFLRHCRTLEAASAQIYRSKEPTVRRLIFVDVSYCSSVKGRRSQNISTLCDPFFQ